ncbi:hypothetical protein FRC07_014456, partial [Ceratobasidium sp. 392]
MSFPPFDSSAPMHTPPLRPIHSQQPQYNAYDQPAYSAMGYGDLPQQHTLRYPTTQGLQYPPQNDQYVAPSFSPTASQFAAQAYASGAGPNPDAMSYPATSRRRYQSTGGALPSHGDARYPMPRRPSVDIHMPTMQESFEFVPSQQPDPTPAPRPGRSSSSGAITSAADSALALEKPRHRETHAVNASGEKPHHCVVCGKSFTRKDALKRHTNQKGCDITMGGSAPQSSSRSSRSSSSPQQIAGTFYPIGSLPHSSSGSQYY